MSFPWLLGQRTTPRVASGTEMSSLPALEAGRPTPRRQGGWAPSGGRAFLAVPSSQRPVTLGCDCSPSPPPPCRQVASPLCRQVASPLHLRLFSCPSRSPLPSGPNSMRPHLNGFTSATTLFANKASLTGTTVGTSTSLFGDTVQPRTWPCPLSPKPVAQRSQCAKRQHPLTGHPFPLAPPARPISPG